MIQHIIELADGRRIRGGEGEPALLSVNLTQTVNTGEILLPGGVCAAMAEISLYAPGESPLAQGDSFTLYEVAEGEEKKVGVFLAEMPQRKSAHVQSVTAFDRVILLDKDITNLLEGLTAWPYSLWELAELVCAYCGVDLAEGEIPNGGYAVRKFSALGVTGRQLLGWIAEAACSFCRADEAGVLRFGWYEETEKVYTPADFYQGTLRLADYTTAPIERVRIRAKEEDVGTIYPESAGEKNTYMITGNPLLTSETAEELLPVAQAVYERLCGVTYTPCSLTVKTGILPGSILQVEDTGGKRHTVYVMERRRSAGRDTLVSTGPAKLDSTTAVNSQSYRALSGKVLSLRTDVEGILAENADARGKLASLQLNVDGITATVQAAQEENKTAFTAMKQTADSLSLAVQTIRQNGTEKLSTAFGLSVDGSAVRIHREGSEMENRLDEKGMYVLRSGETMLSADARGVVATDVTVRNYLSVAHARFEDYGSDRTACFFV